MTVVSWVASDTASWIFFSIGVLSAALAVVKNARREREYAHTRPFFGNLLAWFLVVVGPLLLLGGAVLVAVGAGRLSWLSIFSGAICVAVIAYLRLQNEIRDASVKVSIDAQRILSEWQQWGADFERSLLRGGVYRNFLGLPQGQ